MFRDRKDAGQRLAEALQHCRESDPLVLAIPRGGVEVGVHVALALDADLAVLVVRKLPIPRNPEAGFGAIAEDGSTFLIEPMAALFADKTVQEIVQWQKREVQRRIEVLRHGEPLPALIGRTVILVDDGIAMGSTIRAGIAACRNGGAARIVAAAPVAGPDTTRELRRTADEVVVLETPSDFQAVAQAYERWYDVPDQEVLRLMEEYRRATGRSAPS